VPAGSYLLAGPDGPSALERFRCGWDGSDWGWQSTRLDPSGATVLGRLRLQVDGTSGASRLEVSAGGWRLRGGTAGPDVLWRRGHQEHEVVATGFWGSSPAYALALLLRLRLPEGGTERVRLVEVTEPVLATRTVDQAWARRGPSAYEVTDLATGERWALHWDGGLVDGPGLSLDTGVTGQRDSDWPL
jgi:hypothetical protein